MVTRTGPLVNSARKSRMLGTRPPTTTHTRTPRPHSCFPGPAPHRPWPLPRPFLSSLHGSSLRFGRGGCRRRGAGGPGGCRAEAPRQQRVQGARGRAAGGRRLPGLERVAPRARLQLPGSEEAGPDAEEGAGLWRLPRRPRWRGGGGRGEGPETSCSVLEGGWRWIRLNPRSLLTGARRRKLWQ